MEGKYDIHNAAAFGGGKEPFLCSTSICQACLNRLRPMEVRKAKEVPTLRGKMIIALVKINKYTKLI